MISTLNELGALLGNKGLTLEIGMMEYTIHGKPAIQTGTFTPIITPDTQ